ncbi:hypothetical protein SAMN05660662_2886 [Blastococcus aurantiacus]|uniref:Glycoside-hydrolase family GH114 TIM-barrel domain-containing protein n=1 Tax=Blastococcus aurantiacus TaxID=1550231 RepID=A0A1G7MR96_9ACTN|nr:endo alpha-1,4 polygalactosaminidase [Blastococcus aurantiacus]SDF64368.1 hypothetical protein SAMN05660662_2886 [Blastococcus aurantiacus]
MVVVAAGCSSPDTATPSTGDGSAEPWRPSAGTTWQYQLSGRVDVSADAAVFVVDGADTTADTVRELHDRGRRAVCYVNAGAYEDWRSDASRYPADVLGAPLDGWPGERWLDIRRTDVLLPLLAARLDVCRAKGFDAVEGDNVDGYANESGFPLGAGDQVVFNRVLADLAHERGLAIGLKNDVEQAAELEPSFDFAINEECLAFDECDAYAPFVRAGKAVLNVEYSAPSEDACARAGSLGLSTIVKELDLAAPLRRC